MKLTYYQLEKQLAQKLLPAYIISSDELILKQESIDLIRQKTKAQGFSERTHLVAESGFNWDELYNHLHSASLFAGKRLLELDLTRTLPNKVGGEILKLYGDHPPPDTILIIDIGKMDIKIAKSAWCISLEKTGALVTIWPIPNEQLPQWILKRAKNYKLNLPLNAARMLADYVEGNLIAASFAIEKLYLLAPKQEIDDKLIANIMIDESHYSIFDFVENCIGINTKKALYILEHLKSEGTEPALILWGLTREIRLLSEFRKHMEAGHRLEALLQKQRIFSKRQEAIRRFLTKYSSKDCWHFMLRASEIDKIIKGASNECVWDALALFCLSIHGTV